MALGRSSTKDQIFEVFGREDIKRSLSHIGSIVAPNQELAVARARIMYSERQWVELCVAPASSFMGCLSPDQHGIVGMA